jgi:hypothetical protein
MTQNGEVATYNSQVVGNVTRDGRVLSVGVNFWSTPSAGELAFMNDMMNIFKFQASQSGKYFGHGMGMGILNTRLKFTSGHRVFS